MSEQSEPFLQFLAEEWPQATLEVERFPSGVVCIDVRLRDEMVVIHCWPRDGYGVALLSEEPEEFTGFRHVFSTFEDAIRHLAGVMKRIP